MPSEATPKIIKRGGKVWNIDPEEVARIEGIEDGYKVVRYTIDGNDAETAATIARFKREGYSHKKSKNGLEIEFAMPVNDWYAKQKAMHDAAQRRANSKGATSLGEGITETLERLDSMSVDSFSELE